MSDDLVSTEELAVRMGVSAGTVRNWIKAGKVPVLRPSQRTLRIPLQAALEQLRQRTPNQPNESMVA